MNITNSYNLPEPLAQAITKMANDFPPSPERISVSDLINPPLIRALKQKYWDLLEEDVSDRLWSLLGTAIHLAIQNYTPTHILTELRQEAIVDNITIVGKIDVYYDGIIEDYKVVSVNSFLLGEKQEWINQLNTYAYLMMVNGYPVEKLRINAILRDWMVSKAKEEDYPSIPFVSKEIELWEFDKIENYVKERVAIHKQEPKVCTDEERWKKPTQYALMKEGRKTAIKLLTEEEVNTVVLEKGQYIEKREEEYRRCEYYCPVRQFCPYNPYNIKLKGGVDDEVGISLK